MKNEKKKGSHAIQKNVIVHLLQLLMTMMMVLVMRMLMMIMLMMTMMLWCDQYWQWGNDVCRPRDCAPRVLGVPRWRRVD